MDTVLTVVEGGICFEDVLARVSESVTTPLEKVISTIAYLRTKEKDS